MNADFKDMLSALNAAEVEYLVVGAFAVSAHGHVRATGDLDLWVRRTKENAKRVWQALQDFGAPVAKLSMEDFAAPDIVYQIGVAPRRIDILTSITGVEFETAWDNRYMVRLDGLDIPVLGKRELLVNKKACGRHKDLADVEALESGDL